MLIEPDVFYGGFIIYMLLFISAVILGWTIYSEIRFYREQKRKKASRPRYAYKIVSTVEEQDIVNNTTTIRMNLVVQKVNKNTGYWGITPELQESIDNSLDVSSAQFERFNYDFKSGSDA